MKFFNFETIWLLALGNPKIMIELFTELVSGTEGYEMLEGSDFILNPQVIIQNPYNLTYQQLAEYLGILALRNYQTFKTTRDTDLDMAYVPEYIEPRVVKTNPLIEIQKSKLIFKKEKLYVSRLE